MTNPRTLAAELRRFPSTMTSGERRSAKVLDVVAPIWDALPPCETCSPKKCPRCDSPSPGLHPAMQYEGEVQPCPHDWHKRVELVDHRSVDRPCPSPDCDGGRLRPERFIERLLAPYLDPHANEHLIEFRNNGWTVQHPLKECIDGSLFDCPMANWEGGDIGYRGRYVLYADEDGQLNIGEVAL